MNSDFTKSDAQAAPREPIGSAPRKVHLSGYGVAAWIVAALLVAWVPFFVAWLYMQTQNRMALRQDGRVVLAEITGHWLTSRPLEYTFTVDDVAFSGKARVPQNFVESLRGADHILVRFLPANPTMNHPEAWEESVHSYLVLFCIFSSLCAIMSSLIVATLLEDRRLALDGIIAVGAVTSCKMQKGAWGGIGYQIKSSFRTGDGRPVIGKDVSRSPREVGASVWVLYLPQDPVRNILFPSPYYIVAKKIGDMILE
jgi:hypothetical protein